jgi:hypothetical protein
MQITSQDELDDIKECLSFWNADCFCFKTDQRKWFQSHEYDIHQGEIDLADDDDGSEFIHELLGNFLDLVLRMSANVKLSTKRIIIDREGEDILVDMLLKDYMPLNVSEKEYSYIRNARIQVHQFSYLLDFPINFETFKFSLAIPLLHRLRLFCRFIDGEDFSPKRTKT